jgi:hypothetical protein
MTTQTNQAQSEQAPPKLTPDFMHRLAGDSSVDVVDAVDKAANQANSLLIMIQGQFLDGDKADARLSDETLFDCLDAVRDLVRDMKAVVNAHHQSTRGAGHE